MTKAKFINFRSLIWFPYAVENAWPNKVTDNVIKIIWRDFCLKNDAVWYTVSAWYLVYTWSCAFHIVVMTISLRHNFQNWCCAFNARYSTFVLNFEYSFVITRTCVMRFKYMMCIRDVWETWKQWVWNGTMKTNFMN